MRRKFINTQTSTPPAGISPSEEPPPVDKPDSGAHSDDAVPAGAGTKGPSLGANWLPRPPRTRAEAMLYSQWLLAAEMGGRIDPKLAASLKCTLKLLIQGLDLEVEERLSNLELHFKARRRR